VNDKASIAGRRYRGFKTGLLLDDVPNAFLAIACHVGFRIMMIFMGLSYLSVPQSGGRQDQASGALLLPRIVYTVERAVLDHTGDYSRPEVGCNDQNADDALKVPLGSGTNASFTRSVPELTSQWKKQW
jgi:hypothetical protein